jgi:phosphatidylglycerophosphate synthase
MARERWTESAIEVVLLSTAATPSDPASDRLIVTLREHGIDPDVITVIADPDSARLRSRLAAVLAGPVAGAGALSADERLSGGGQRPTGGALPAIAVLAADIVVNATPLGAVLDDPRVRTGALALSSAEVAADGSGVHRNRQSHLGVLKLDGAGRATAAALVAGLPADPDRPGDLLLELTRALTDAGIDVRPVQLGGYAWARPESAAQEAEAVAAVEAVDERTVRLRAAARGGDGFYSTFVLRRISWRFTSLAERVGLTPNQVTLISFGLGLVAAGFLAMGSRPWAVAGALLLQFCLIVDCVDGELARYRRRFSRFGAWLDATTDRVKEFAAIGALAVAAARHERDLWWLVAAAIALQTFRNLLDLGWALQRGVAAASSDRGEPVRPEWVAPANRLHPPVGVHTGEGALSWLKRVGHFPIGERFLLISLGAALWTPRATLIALLVAGMVSAGYMLLAFAVRSRSAIGNGHRIVSLVDSGPVLGAALRQAVGRRAGRAAAALPAMVAVDELALIWWFAVVLAGADRSAAVVLIAAAAIAHYQHAYGVREDGSTEGPGAAAGRRAAGGFVIGTDLRLVALALVAVVPTWFLTDGDARSWATSAVWALAGLVAISSTIRSLQAWTGTVDPSNAPDEADSSDQPGSSGGPEGHLPAGAESRSVSGGQSEGSVDRMQTVNADTNPTARRQAIGGVR